MNKHRSESGQAIVVVVVGILALGFMLVLTLDGGILLMQQREAQSYADPSALAGATQLCSLGEGSSEAEIAAAHAAAASKATEYATTLNDATSLDSITFLSNTRIRVTVSMTRPSAFAGMMGFSTLTASATAGAECLPAGEGENLLPFVFACEPPEGEVASDSEDCVQKVAENPDNPVFPTDYYIVHNSDPVDDGLECIEPPNTGPSDPEYISGEYDCDFDDDGVDDFIDGGDRGWISLEPGTNPGASNLVDWIENGCEDCELSTHLWLAGTPGVSTSVFEAVKGLGPDYPIVLFPIFSNFCPDSFDPEIECPDRWHEPPDDPQDDAYLITGNSDYYHVAAFAAFQITCVQTKVADACPYRAYVGLQPGFEDFLVPPVNIKTIEGYFVEVISPDLGPGPALDTGAYVVRLYE